MLKQGSTIYGFVYCIEKGCYRNRHLGHPAMLIESTKRGEWETTWWLVSWIAPDHIMFGTSTASDKKIEPFLYGRQKGSLWVTWCLQLHTTNETSPAIEEQLLSYHENKTQIKMSFEKNKNMHYARFNNICIATYSLQIIRISYVDTFTSPLSFCNGGKKILDHIAAEDQQLSYQNRSN